MGKIDDVLIDPFADLYDTDIVENLDKIKQDSNKPSKKKGKSQKDETESDASEKKPDKSREINKGDEKRLVEAALFTSVDPISLNQLGQIINISSLGLVKKIVDELKEEYSGRGLEITQMPDGYQMQVRKEYIPNISSLTPHQDLSDGVKRTLALIVYKEPLKQSELIDTQGSKAYAYVKELVRRGLVKGEKFGRTKILRVTKEFENYFGIEKQKIKELLTQKMAQYEVQKESKGDVLKEQEIAYETK